MKDFTSCRITKALLLNLLFFTVISSFAQQNISSIYHKGWTDLNKNGRKDVYEDASQPIEKRVQEIS